MESKLAQIWAQIMAGFKIAEPDGKRSKQRDTKSNGLARAMHRAAKLKAERDGEC